MIRLALILLLIVSIALLSFAITTFLLRADKAPKYEYEDHTHHNGTIYRKDTIRTTQRQRCELCLPWTPCVHSEPVVLADHFVTTKRLAAIAWEDWDEEAQAWQTPSTFTKGSGIK